MKKNFDRQEVEVLVSLTPEQIEAMPYETAAIHLEQVVEALEKEGTPLDLGLKLYELGSILSRKCGKILDQTEAKVVALIGDSSNPREENFDPEKDGR